MSRWPCAATQFMGKQPRPVEKGGKNRKDRNCICFAQCFIGPGKPQPRDRRSHLDCVSQRFQRRRAGRTVLHDDLLGLHRPRARLPLRCGAYIRLQACIRFRLHETVDHHHHGNAFLASARCTQASQVVCATFLCDHQLSVTIFTINDNRTLRTICVWL